MTFLFFAFFGGGTVKNAAQRHNLKAPLCKGSWRAKRD